MKEFYEKIGGEMMVTDLSVLLQDLVTSYQSMLGIAEEIEKLSKNTKMLSFNSSIEAARAGEAGRGFAVIAEEIKKFSDKSQESNQKNLEKLEDFHHKIFEVIGVRTADMAFDLIDKIDRNLFERYCDVQAWATFEEIIAQVETPSEENFQRATTLLQSLVHIYEVYYEVYLTDLNGSIVAAAVNQEMVGVDVSQKKWYQNTIKNKTIQVSDIYRSDSNHECTVTYSCPIYDKKGDIIGVLSSRFNWNFVHDIIENAKIGKQGKIYVINSDGMVIASKNREEVLAKNLADFEPAKQVLSGKHYGYTIEEENRKTLICGYAKSKGYNAYPGKGWSVLVIEDFQQGDLS